MKNQISNINMTDEVIGGLVRLASKKENVKNKAV